MAESKDHSQKVTGKDRVSLIFALYETVDVRCDIRAVCRDNGGCGVSRRPRHDGRGLC